MAVIVRKKNKIILKVTLVAAILQSGQNMEELGLELKHEKTNILAFKIWKM